MTFVLWRLTDNKPGHDSQSRGLCKAIQQLQDCKQFDIAVNSSLANVFGLVFKRFPAGAQLEKPDLIIASGHNTHIPALAAKRAYGGKTIILMRPSLPTELFDLCVIPEHDNPPLKDNIIHSKGALNEIKFNENKKTNTGLILIGGPSKHYAWDGTNIKNQIAEILSTQKEVKWVIANSPRTPLEFLEHLQLPSDSNYERLNYIHTSPGDIQSYISDAERIWVSRDSVSMIYESISSGAKVGLINLKINNENNKLYKSIESLVSNGLLTTFEQWQSTGTMIPNTSKLNESIRCATLLGERGLFKQNDSIK